MSQYEHVASSSSPDTYTPEQLFAGDTPPVATGDEVVLSGQNIAIHKIVARDSVSGKFVAYNPAGSNGANVALGIAAAAIDASAADKSGPIYKAGCFNVDYLATANSLTVAQVKAAFDGKPILVKSLTYSVG